MANLLKKQVTRILEKDVNDEEIDHFMIILDQNGKWDTKAEVSTTEISQNIQSFFLNNIQSFLQQYSPLYTEFKEIISSVNELDISLNRMEECMSELRIKNMIILNKLQKLQAKESQIDEKISLLGELISKISLDRSQIEAFLSDDTPVDDQFLDLFNNLDNIEEMDNFLLRDGLENSVLRNSLLKNTNEIKSIGFTKLLKYLNRNIDSVPHDLLKKAIQLIMRNSKMQENLQKILNIRKNVLNNQFKNLVAKHDKYENTVEFLWALVNGIDEALENELDLFNGEEKMDLKAMEFLFEDMFRDLEGKLAKYAYEEGHSFLEVYKITNYFYYLDSSITAKLNKYSPGYFEANPTSRFRSHLVGFTTILSEDFQKRLEGAIELPSDASSFDLTGNLTTIYDILEQVKVILRYIDSSFLPTSREEKVLPLNRAFFVPSLDLLLHPLNKVIRTLLSLPRGKAREGHVHVILLLSNLDKLYKELKLAVKKMEELARSQENVKQNLKETIATLCVLRLRELVADYEITKDQMKASVEEDKVEIVIQDKGFIYRDEIGKLVRFCVGVCKNEIKFKEVEAEAWLDKEYRRRVERKFREVVMILYEKSLKKVVEYAEEPGVGPNLIKKLEKIFDVEEGKIELEDAETVRKRFVGVKENEEDIEANL